MRPDDFPKPVVRTLGTRAGYICSNPNCRKLTAGPHSDPAKHVITGVAAHIHAASVNGPRYLGTQTPEQRRSAANGIWLCAVCSKKVDTDWAAWPDQELFRMKEEHEKWIDGQEMIPKLPVITMTTLSGLRLHNNLASVTGDDLKRLREQQVLFHNKNRVPLYNVKLVMVLPEELCIGGHGSWNPGTQLVFKPAESDWTVESVAGTNRVAAPPKRSPTTNYLLSISQIPPGEHVELSFYTANPVEVKLADTPQGPWRRAPDPDTAFPPNHLMFFIEGSYQFILRSEHVTTDILVPLKYSFKDRLISSLPVQETREPWNLAPLMRFPGLEIHG